MVELSRILAGSLSRYKLLWIIVQTKPFNIYLFFYFQLSLTRKEHNFLKEICLTALSVDKNVRFVAIADNNGKLLAGECNKNQFLKNNSTMIKSSIFYFHYLIPTIRYQQEQEEVVQAKPSTNYDRINDNNNHNNNNIVHFNLADLGNTLFLAVTKLAEKKNRYLCIYLESYSASSSSFKLISHERIISKITAALR